MNKYVMLLQIFYHSSFLYGTMSFLIPSLTIKLYMKYYILPRDPRNCIFQQASWSSHNNSGSYLLCFSSPPTVIYVFSNRILTISRTSYFKTTCLYEMQLKVKQKHQFQKCTYFKFIKCFQYQKYLLYVNNRMEYHFISMFIMMLQKVKNSTYQVKHQTFICR